LSNYRATTSENSYVIRHSCTHATKKPNTENSANIEEKHNANTEPRRKEIGNELK